MNRKPNNMIGCRLGRSLWMAAFVLLFAGGCATIDDNMNDCYALASLQMIYTNNMSGEDLFREQVSSLDLYVYNRSDSMLFTTKHITQAEMVAQKYNISLDWLRRGDYYIVALGNKHDDYYESQSHDNFSSLRVKMLCSDGVSGRIYENPCHFFHGTTTVGWNELGAKTVPMTKSTNNINVHIRTAESESSTRSLIKGLPDFEVNITAQNGMIKHDNLLAREDTRTMTHISHNEFADYAQKFSTTLTVGRLFQNDGSRIVIKERGTSTNAGTVHYTQSLTDTILDNDDWEGDPDAYLHRQDEYNFYYTVEVKAGIYVVTEITLEEWNAIDMPVQGV